MTSRNHGTHKTDAIKRWLASRPHLHVHFTPTSASSLNQVERWFATLTERCIRRGTHRSTRALEQAIRSYLDVNNSAPRPFCCGNVGGLCCTSIVRSPLRRMQMGLGQ